MALPEKLTVICVVGGSAVAGAWVTATLHMDEKTDFISFHGPADAAGSVAVRGGDILGWARIHRDFAPSDYADPESQWSGKITLAPLTIEAARAAIKFFKMFSDRLDYPETFSADLRGLIATLTPLQGQDMTLQLAAADPPEAEGIVRLRRRPL